MSGHHALIAPSSMDRTMACNAWIQLSVGLPPEPETDEAMEGNAADWVAKQYAAGNEVPYGAPIPLPGNHTVDYDMIHGAKMWVKALGYGAVSGVPVICERIHPTDCWGEPDGWRYDGIEGILRLPDYKYGFELVEVFENWQLIPYASGLIETLKLPPDTVVEFKIVQPRAHHREGPVRQWRIRADKLEPYIVRAYNAAVRALPPPGIEIAPPIAKTGPHCLHCPARVHCTTFQTGVSQVLSFASSMGRSGLNEHAVGVQLGLVQDALKLLKAQESSLEAQAESLLRSGKRVPGYGLEPGSTRLEWREGVTADEVIALGEIIRPGAPIDLRRAPGAMNARTASPVVTPTQAIKAGIDAAVIDQYAHRPHGAMKLARESVSYTRRIFGESNT